MAAIGYATMAIIPSISGLNKAIRAQIEEPMKKAAQKSSKNLSSSVESAYQKIEKSVDSARKAQEKWEDAVTDAEENIQKAKEVTAEKVKLVEAAESRLAKARISNDAKVKKAEDELAKLRADELADVAKIKEAEKKLEAAKQGRTSAVTSAEVALSKARRSSAEATEKEKEAEEELKKATTKLADAKDNLTAKEKAYEAASKNSLKLTSKMSNAFKNLNGKIKGTASKISEFSKQASLSAGVGLGGVTAMAKGAIDYASQAEQSYGAVESIFKNHAKTLNDVSKNAVDTLGLSGREYRELAATTGAMLKNSTMPLDEVADKTQDLIKLGADLAATFGGSTAEAMEAISSLLRGEADPIERYGVSLKQSDVNARMAAEGLDKLEGSAAKQAETQTRLKLLFEQTADAQGQFAREGGSAAQEAEKQAKRLDDLKEKIGTDLLPVYVKLMDKLGKATGFIAEHSDAVIIAAGAFSALAGGILAISGVSSAIGAINAALAPFELTLGGIVAAAAPWAAAIGAIAGGLYLFFTKTEKGKELWDKITESFGKSVDWIKEKVSGFKDVVVEKFNAIKEAFQNFKVNPPEWLTTLRDKFSGIFDKFNIGEFAKRLGDFLKGSLGETVHNLIDSAKGIVDIVINIGIAIGKSLMPVIKGVWDMLKGLWDLLSPVLIPTLKVLGTILGGTLFGAFLGVIKVIEWLSALFKGLVDVINWVITEAISPLMEVLGIVLGAIGTALGGLFSYIKDGFVKAWDWVSGFISKAPELWQSLKDGVSSLGGFFSGLWDTISSGWESLKAGFSTFWGTVSGILDAIKNGFITTFQVIATIVLTPFVLAWNGLAAGFKLAYDTVIKPVIDAFANAFSYIYNSVILPVVGFIVDKWNWLSAMLQAGWSYIKVNVIDRFIAGFNNLWQVVLNVAGWISGKWQWLSSMLAGIWNTIKTYVLDAFGSGMNILWGVVNSVTTWISNKWNWLKDTLAAIWKWIDANVFSPLKAGFHAIWLKALSIVNNIVDKWNYMRDKIHAGVTFVKDVAFGIFKSALNTLRDSFQRTVDNIRNIWDRIKGIAARPIKFVVETVYNNGIRKAWNLVSKFTGLDDLPEAKLGALGAYARGGVLPGYRPGYDDYHFIDPVRGTTIDLSGGEGIIRPEAVKGMGGKGAIDAINNAAMSGGIGAVRKLLGQGASIGAYKKGGVLDDRIDRTLNEARKHHGKPYQWGGVGNPSFDCSGLWSAVVNHLNGHSFSGRLFTTHPFMAGQGGNWGFVPGLSGPVTVGVSDDHMAGTMRGINIESASDPKGVQIGGSAWGSNHSYFPRQFTLASLKGEYLPGATSGGGGGVSMRSIIAGIVDPILSGVESKIPTFPGLIGKVPKAMFTKLKDAALEKINGSAAANTDAGANANYTAGAGVEQWRPLVNKILREKGYPESLAGSVLRRMNQESGGAPNAINNWDSNAAAGIPSKGLMQVIDPTFQAHKDPGHDNIWNPEDNIRASMNYAIARYGSLTAAYDRAGGYARGGIVELPKLYDNGGWLNHGETAINKSGKPEPVFTNKQWGIMSRLATASAGILKTFQDNGKRLAQQIGSQVGNALSGSVDVMKLLDEQNLPFLKGIGTVASSVETLNKASEDSAKAVQELKAKESELANARGALSKLLEDKNAKQEDIATAKDKVSEAEKGLSDAQKAVAETAQSSTAAQGAMAKAIVELVTNFGIAMAGAFESYYSGVAKLWETLGAMAKQQEEWSQKLSEDRMAMVNLRMQEISALNDFRTAQWDANRVRLEGALSVAQAEKELQDLREEGVLLGATGIDAMSAAMDRYRQTGIFAIEEIAYYTEQQAAKIKAAEWNVHAARIKAHLDDVQAEKNVQLAKLKSAQATLAQVSAAQILQLTTERLQKSAEMFYGVTAQGANAMAQHNNGKAMIGKGAGTIIGGIGQAFAGAASGFATGGPLGALIGGLVGGFGAIGSIIKGSAEIKKGKAMRDLYEKEAAEEAKKLPENVRKDMEKWSALGGVGAFFGADGASIAETGLYELNLKQKKLAEDYQYKLDALELDKKIKDSMLGLQESAVTEEYESKIAALQAALDAANYAKDAYSADNPAVAEANKALYENAVKQREEALEAHEETSSYLNSILDGVKDISTSSDKKIAAQGLKPQIVEVPVIKGTAYASDEVAELLKAIDDRTTGIELRVKEMEDSTPTTAATDYLRSNK